jgi:hypothetical protein
MGIRILSLRIGKGSWRLWSDSRADLAGTRSLRCVCDSESEVQQTGKI